MGIQLKSLNVGQLNQLQARNLDRRKLSEDGGGTEHRRENDSVEAVPVLAGLTGCFWIVWERLLATRPCPRRGVEHK